LVDYSTVESLNIDLRNAHPGALICRTVHAIDNDQARRYDVASQMTHRPHITSIEPAAGIPGGEVRVQLSGISQEMLRRLSVRFSEVEGHLVTISSSRALVLVPDEIDDGSVRVTTSEDESGPHGPGDVQFTLGKRLARNLHPVANPAFDPQDGALFVTRSGSRGEHVPTSIFRIDCDGSVEEFSGDIMNPTSMAFDRTNRMFVTSRFDGTVYRITPDRQVAVFASDLGIATGLAFNRDGEMFVGDRSGTIHRINEIGEASPWAEHEPSVSAYHLAFGSDNDLYVSGPTVSSFDSITRFDQSGNASVFFRGLGRPQGLAFDREGNLYVAAALRGRRGVVKISSNGSQAELVVAGMNVVGLAFGPNGEMVVATNEAVYSLPLGIEGLLS
jgi:sugar lactone lactonase YvrE